MTEANWSNAGEMLIIDSDFAILGIALGSGLLDPGSLDPGSLDPGNLDPGNLDPGNLDPGHRPRGWLWWGKKWTAALLVKRTSAAVPTLKHQRKIMNENFNSFLQVLPLGYPGLLPWRGLDGDEQDLQSPHCFAF